MRQNGCTDVRHPEQNKCHDKNRTDDPSQPFLKCLHLRVRRNHQTDKEYKGNDKAGSIVMLQDNSYHQHRPANERLSKQDLPMSCHARILSGLIQGSCEHKDQQRFCEFCRLYRHTSRQTDPGMGTSGCGKR